MRERRAFPVRATRQQNHRQQAQQVLTYSESGDPKSPHYADQTLLFSKKQWRPILFTDAQIAGDAN
ncbi:penicillin acylase family protein, partial [Corallococcus llansteffanensis]|uniref:penicillin acylase family protein n=1 Tax=Corallococcus llansteffanensis TaxID=2316731 RepID=UPI0035566969